MKKVKGHYTLSVRAKKDLITIFDYTESKYTFEKAILYTREFQRVFNHLLFMPTMGRLRNEIKRNLYNIAKNEHIVFYRILNDKIRIVRVLHGSRDLPKNFK